MLDEVGREENDEAKKALGTKVFVFLAGAVLLLIALIYGLTFTYHDPTDATDEVQKYYNYFRDISVMIFIGFGFLMTFVRRGSFSALGYTLFTSVIAIMFSVPWETVFKGEPDSKIDGKYPYGVYELLNGLFCAASVMISYGAVLGRVTPLQMLLLGVIEPFWYWLNLYIGDEIIGTVDIGGGIFIHTFGCYFGLSMSLLIINTSKTHHPDEQSNYASDVFAMIGTLFLWVMWPSFNAAIASPDGQNRAVVNTFISLSGSTIVTFLCAQLLHKGKFDMVMIQNSTLAGGVAMGVVADVRMAPSTAFIVGTFAGIVSTCGYHFITPKIYQKFNIQDVCGIHNLHGMPGLIGSILSIITTFFVSLDYPHEGKQPIFQIIAIVVTVIVAIAGGLITGLILRFSTKFLPMTSDDLFNDKRFWAVPSDYENVARSTDLEHH